MPFDLNRVFVYGRVKDSSRKAVSERLGKQDGKLVRKASQATTIVVARAAAAECLDDQLRLVLPFQNPNQAVLISEDELKVALGLLGPAYRHDGGPYSIQEVSRLAGLAEATCAALALFDVAGSSEGFGYPDLTAAKQVATLLGSGVKLVAVIEASVQLRRRGIRLSQTRLTEASWGGEVVQKIGTDIARLNGQFFLAMDGAAEDVGSYIDRALESEANGDFEEAERLYQRAAQIDKRDAIIPFNLGNLLAMQGRVAEAAIAFKKALALDHSFAEAAFNLAEMLDTTGQDKRAIEAYKSTLAAYPGYAQAAYNLARLLTRTKRFAEALPLWERFIELAPDDPDIGFARRGALLCRLEIRNAERSAPETPH